MDVNSIMLTRRANHVRGKNLLIERTETQTVEAPVEIQKFRVKNKDLEMYKPGPGNSATAN